MNEVLTPRPLVITFAEQCHQGKVREENQDSVLHVCFALGELFIVADGMGGYTGGATASRMVVEGFHEYLASLSQDYPPDQAIREASARVNASIVAAANSPNSPNKRMGSTVVLALVQQDTNGTRAWIGHIGDSRAYLVRAGQMSRITNDHSAVQALINRNLLTPEEALHHPDASVLTRCMGHQGEVEIDIDMILMEAGDSLLLCSDGLWGFVPEPEIQLVATNPQLTVETAAQSLLDLSLAAGGHDNIGIEMVRLNPAPIATPPLGKRLHIGVIEVLALCLLAVAGLGASIHFGMRWLHQHRIPGMVVPLPATTVNFAVVRGPKSDETIVSFLLASGWELRNIPKEQQKPCRDAIGEENMSTIFFTDGKGIGASLSKYHTKGTLWDKVKLQHVEEANQVMQKCGQGQFDVILFLPDHKPGDATKITSDHKPDAQEKHDVKGTPTAKPNPGEKPKTVTVPTPAPQANAGINAGDKQKNATPGNQTKDSKTDDPKMVQPKLPNNKPVETGQPPASTSGSQTH